MKLILPSLLLFSAAFSHGNQLLDILEGKVDANSVNLPPPPPEFVPEVEEEVENIIFLEPEWAASPPDIIWSRAVLYNNSANPWVQQVALMGHFDFQASMGNAETEASGMTPARNTELDGTRTRRARLGARIRAFNNTEIEAVGEFAGDAAYRGIERLKAHTELTDTAAVTYGKFTPNFGNETRTDERLSPFPHGTMIGSLIAPASTLGISLRHTGQKYNYDVGWFSSDYDPDFGSLGGAGMMNFSVSRTIYEKVGKGVARVNWHADYIHNFDAGSSNPQGYNLVGRTSANGNQLIVQNPAYRHLFSIGVKTETELSTFTGDFQLGKGDSTVWGMTLGATHWLIPGTLNLVGRYQYAGSNDALAIAATPGNSGNLRYDNSPFFAGDTYHSLYLGANLHLYKDEFVIRNGLEYFLLQDDAGNSFNTDSFIWHSGATLSF